MAKPRGTFTRSKNPKRAKFVNLGEPSIEIAAWCPDDKAQKPPEQVHLIHTYPGVNVPFILRFKSPDTLGFIIEELARYRRLVWPASEPLDLSGEFPTD